MVVVRVIIDADDSVARPFRFVWCGGACYHRR